MIVVVFFCLCVCIVIFSVLPQLQKPKEGCSVLSILYNQMQQQLAFLQNVLGK